MPTPFWLLANFNYQNLFDEVLGLVSSKRLAEKIFPNASLGNTAALLFATSPMIISVGTQGMTDFILACLFLFILVCALENKLLPSVLAICLAVSFKETAMTILVPTILVFLTSTKLCLKQKSFSFLVLSILPLAVFFGWKTFLESQGSSLWRVWIFGQTTSSDVILFVIDNLLHFRIINPNFIENLKILFFLNFNWVFWLAWLVSLIRLGIAKQVPLLMVTASYMLLALSFPTYSVPRYTLPALVMVYIGAIGGIRILGNKTVPIILLLFLNLFSGFTSMDPISQQVWPVPAEFGRFWVFRQTLYNLDEKKSGNDRITYNLQSLLISVERTKVLKTMQNKALINSPDCLWLSRDALHDLITLRLLQVYLADKFPECDRKI